MCFNPFRCKGVKSWVELVWQLMTVPFSLAAAQDLGIANEDFAAVVIVSIRNVAGQAQTSVNLRAPVFLDARHRTGCQYVMPNGAYQVRHVLNSLDEIMPPAPIK